MGILSLGFERERNALCKIHQENFHSFSDGGVTSTQQPRSHWEQSLYRITELFKSLALVLYELLMFVWISVSLRRLSCWSVNLPKLQFQNQRPIKDRSKPLLFPHVLFSPLGSLTGESHACLLSALLAIGFWQVVVNIHYSYAYLLLWL